MTLVRTVVGEIALGQAYESRRKTQTWKEEPNKQSKGRRRLETRSKDK